MSGRRLKLRSICRGSVLLLLCGLVACGGGGGGGGGGGAAPAPTPTPPPGPTQAQLNAAAAFLQVTTFGPTVSEIDEVATQGTEAWLDSQLAMAPSYHLPIVEQYAQSYGEDINGQPPRGTYRRFAFWQRAVAAPDQLRQLVAYALSQIFVISDTMDVLGTDTRALASFYDMLLEHSFGNYRELLRAVTLHPAMGVYLSHVNNGRSDPVANTFPDENYAREVMQLFSIGLYELNPDGSRRLDSNGQPIATYDNADIREFAKIFTGLSYGPAAAGGSSFFGNPVPVLYVPMQMFDDFHEPGEKLLLNGLVVPDGQNGLADIDAAIDNLFNHPNTGPFITRQLIQRLVTSNPSADYVARIAAVFDDNGAGTFGGICAQLCVRLLPMRKRLRRCACANRSGAMWP